MRKPHWILLATIGLTLSSVVGSSVAAEAVSPQTFKAAGDRLFDFDTGSVKGRLRANGKYQGISSLVDSKTGKELTRSAGIFSYYRVLSADQRWGKSARDWPMTAKLLPDGGVQIDWPAQEDHPLEITATYRWRSPTTLDLETVVRPQQSMPRFELFLSSYFGLNFKAFVYAKPARSPDERPEFIAADVNPLVRGSYLAFPIDRQAATMFFDRRWAPENGLVPWSVTRMLGAPMGMKRDPETGITLLLMSRPEDCFAIDMSYNMQPPDGIGGHSSIYMSLFGRDIESGKSERAHVRLVVERDLAFERAIELYEFYTKERRPRIGANREQRPR